MTQATLLKDDASAAPTSDFPGPPPPRQVRSHCSCCLRYGRSCSHTLRQRDLAPLPPAQMEQLMQAAEAILEGKPGKIVAVPFRPGFGKSTPDTCHLEQWELPNRAYRTGTGGRSETVRRGTDGRRW